MTTNPLDTPDRDFGKMHPECQVRALCFFNECGKRRISVFATEIFRPWDRQGHLYAIGRTRELDRPKVTFARPGESYHNLILFEQPRSAAFDVAVYNADEPWSKRLEWNGDAEEWERVKEAAEAAGLETLEFEQCHLQLPFPLEELKSGLHWPARTVLTPAEARLLEVVRKDQLLVHSPGSRP